MNLLILAIGAAFAQDAGGPMWGEVAAAPPESRRAQAEEITRLRPAIFRELQLFATVQIRGAANDLVSTNPFLDGQVLGTLGGSNGVTVDSATRSLYAEQRVGAFTTWRPKLLDGHAGLSAAFEVDFAFGDEAYGVGGNKGGGFGADQVNLQTRRLHADGWFDLGRNHHVHAVGGLQFVADSASDPTASGPDGVLREGGRLMFFGSEAAGVTLYGRLADDWGERLRWRLGGYVLVEQGLSLPDDVWLAMADVSVRPAWNAQIGLHAWYLQDRSGGTGGLLGYGPTSALSGMQGGPQRELYDEGYGPPDDATIDADLAWIAVDGGLNGDLTRGPFGLTGVAVLNVGKLYAPIAHDDLVLGGLLDVEARYRYAAGKGSLVRAEVLYSSADDSDIQRHTSVITGNSYGFAAAVHATHGTYLLFPDPGSINRMVSVVHDVSGGGRGVLGLTAAMGYDPVPDRLNVRAGFGHARAPSGAAWGTEGNLTLTAQPLPFLNLYTAGAVLVPGSEATFTPTAWTAYAGLDWLAF